MIESFLRGPTTVGDFGKPASVAAPSTASSRPPRASTMCRSFAWAPDTIRPSAKPRTCARSSFRPVATAEMNCAWTSSSKACKTRRSSGVMVREMLPMSLYCPAFTVTYSTPTFFMRPSRFGSWKITPMDPVRVPGLA